jgi:hypothetical protein
MFRNPSGDGDDDGAVDAAAAPLLSPRLRNVATGRVLRPVAGIAIGAELVCLTVIVLSAAGGHRMLVPASRHTSPAWLLGPLPALHQGLSSTDIGALLVTMVLGYGVALALADRVPGRWPLAIAGGAIALCWLAPPLLSADVFGYVAWGKLGAHGVNPYSHASIAVGHDAVRPFLLWHHGTSPYGPLFSAMTFALAPLGVGVALWTLKTVAALCALACVALLWRAAAQLGRPQARAALAFGLNPLVLVYGVGGAHNDLMVGTVGLAGVLAFVCGRERSGAGAVVAAAAMKASAVVALPFLIAGSRRWRRPAVAAVATGAVLVAGGFALFGTPLLHLVDAVGAEQHDVAVHSIPAEIARLAGSGTLPSWAHLLSGALLLAAVVALLYRVRRGADWLTGAGWAYVAVIVTTAWLLPWYVAWAVPFAALSADRRLLGAVWALTLSIAVLRLPVFA